MKIDILTILPSVFDKVFDESILGAAKKNGLIEVRIFNFRDFAEGKHKTVDDSPFGGGPGMLLKPSPLVACLREIRKRDVPGPVIGLSPQGMPLHQTLLKQLARFDRIILVSGRYEGFDDRILPEFDLEISIGDYVISGGEFAAMVFVDGISRLIPGTVGRIESVEQDSFFDGSLDHPQFTRPFTWEKKQVPQILTEGNHEKIRHWRRRQALFRTAVRRPDLYSALYLSEADTISSREGIEEYSIV